MKYVFGHVIENNHQGTTQYVFTKDIYHINYDSDMKNPCYAVIIKYVPCII